MGRYELSNLETMLMPTTNHAHCFKKVTQTFVRKRKQGNSKRLDLDILYIRDTPAGSSLVVRDLPCMRLFTASVTCVDSGFLGSLLCLAPFDFKRSNSIGCC